jgi:hypothetical protein
MSIGLAESREESMRLSHLQDATQLTLARHVTISRPTNPERFGQLLLLLPALLSATPSSSCHVTAPTQL